MTREHCEHAKFMRHAIALAYQGMAGGHGGPFGAVVVKDGEIVGQGHNRVVSSKDPTAHAEVTAIRDASKSLQRFDLSDCEIFVNGLPCPMCMSRFSGPAFPRCIMAAPLRIAEAIGFDDQEFYRQLAKPAEERLVSTVTGERVLRGGAAMLSGLDQ